MNPAIARPRLLDLLLTANPSIVTAVAGAGAGKTTLVNQLAEHLGPDRSAIIDCASKQCRAEGLRSALELVVGVESGKHTVDESAGLGLWLAERYGGDLTLCLDGVEVLRADHGGVDDPANASLLGELVEHADQIGRLVLTGRERIPGLARRRSAGQVFDISAETLMFTSDENMAVTGTANGAFNGWPALEDLVESSGPEAVREYVVEEIINPMTHDRRVMVAAVASGCRQRNVLAAALGETVSLREFESLSTVPLVTLRDGELRAHPIWSQLTDRLVDRQDRSRILVRAAKAIMTDDPDHATQLLVESIDQDDLSHTVEVWARLGYSGVPRRVLLGLTGAGSEFETEGSRPDLDLVRGLLRRSANPMAEEAVTLLSRAADGFAAQGNDAAQLVARSELGFTHRMRGESRQTMQALNRAVALADRLGPGTDGDIRAKAMMARAVLADEAGDDLEVLRYLQLLEEQVLPQQFGSATYLLAMLASLHVGDGTGAVEFAHEFKRSAPPDRAWAACLPMVAAWHAGQPFDAGQTLDEFDHHRTGNAVDRVWSGSSLALLAAFRHEVDRADDALVEARSACPQRALPRMQSLLASAEASLAVANDDEARARELILEFLEASDEDPEGRSIVRSFHWCLAVAYVVCPELRSAIDHAPLGPALAYKRRAGQAFVAWREEGEAPGDLFSSDHRALIAALPARWAAALVAGLPNIAHATTMTSTAIEVYGEAVRNAWKELDDPAAQKLARTLPVDPGTTIEIRDLGSLELLIDGSPVTHQNWDRDRVQALMGLLTHHRSISRDEVMLSLWPDLDEEAARRNLRVTLSHLQSLIEPGRSKGDAPFYIRATGDRLCLHETRSLAIDSDRFEALIDSAQEVDAEGRFGAVIDLLTEATGLWRGDYLCRFRYEDWPQLSATRLRSRFVGACVRLGEIRLSLDQPVAAVRAAERAIAVDPWSEAAYTVSINGHLASGNRAGALRAYRNCVESLSELGVRPEAVADLIETQGLGPAGQAASSSPLFTASTA